MLIDYLVMKYGIGLVEGVRSVGAELCMVFLLLVLRHFDCLGGGVECVLGHSLSKVGVVEPSEGCFNVMFSGGVVFTSITPGMFAIVTRWCVHGDKRICVGAIDADDVWVVTYSSPRCPLFSHSLVCIKNHLFIVGIGPILNKELELIFDLIGLIVRAFIVRYR